MRKFLYTGLTVIATTWLGFTMLSCEQEDENPFPDFSGNYVVEVNEGFNTCSVLGMNMPRGDLGIAPTTFNHDRSDAQINTGGLIFCAEIDREGNLSGESYDPILVIDEDANYTINGKLQGMIIENYLIADLILSYDLDLDGIEDCRTENVLKGPGFNLYDCDIEEAYEEYGIEESLDEKDFAYDVARAWINFHNPWN